MADYQRNLSLYVEDSQVAAGCRINLSAREVLSILPALHHVTIQDLSDLSIASLSEGRSLQVRSDDFVICSGTITEVYTHIDSGKKLTSVVFSPQLALWNASVSFSVPSGMPVRTTIEKILENSGTDLQLAGYAADNPALLRPQAFFGRAADALSVFAEMADADIFIGPAGVIVSGRNQKTPVTRIQESALLSEPIPVGKSLILSTIAVGLPLGTVAETEWKGMSYTGRIVSSFIQADNVSGPWKTELELELV